MLFELCPFVINQGRYREAKALLDECVEILAFHQRSSPWFYFNALNYYAVYLLHIKDFEAAQKILEHTIDLTLAAMKPEPNVTFRLSPADVNLLQFVMHMNLAFLLMEMQDLAQAKRQLDDADTLLPFLSKGTRATWGDYYLGICALWEFHSGRFAEAAKEIARAVNPDEPVCLRVRAKLHLVRQEFVEAGLILRASQAAERRLGTLHRPGLLELTLDLAESLFGQGKHDEAFTALQEARAIAKDFDLPADDSWRKSLAGWLSRARRLGKVDVSASLEDELRKMPPSTSHAVTILEKLRGLPQSQG